MSRKMLGLRELMGPGGTVLVLFITFFGLVGGVLGMISCMQTGSNPNRSLKKIRVTQQCRYD